MLRRYGKAYESMDKEANNTYDDIINMEHPTSKRHPRMTVYNRAAQFSPFAALTGYENALKETARLADEKIELDENVKIELDYKLQQILNKKKPVGDVYITYFEKDKNKEGGAYLKTRSKIKKIDEYKKTVEFVDGKEIFIDDIVSIEEEF